MAKKLTPRKGLCKVQAAPTTLIEARAVAIIPPQSPAYPGLLELQHRLQLRSDICRFLLKALGFSTVCCFALIFLQGFHAWGFQMSESFLRWLYGVTVAQLVTFLGIFVREVWARKGREPSKISQE